MKVSLDIDTLPFEKQKELYVFLKDKFDPLHKSLEELGFSRRVINALAKKDIYTGEDIGKYTMEELLAIEGFGNGCAKKVEFTLRDLGIHIKEK